MFISASMMDYSKMTLEEVLRTYSSVKEYSTRCEREINSLIDMLKVQYLLPLKSVSMTVSKNWRNVRTSSVT